MLAFSLALPDHHQHSSRGALCFLPAARQPILTGWRSGGVAAIETIITVVRHD